MYSAPHTSSEILTPLSQYVCNGFLLVVALIDFQNGVRVYSIPRLIIEWMVSRAGVDHTEACTLIGYGYLSMSKHRPRSAPRYSWTPRIPKLKKISMSSTMTSATTGILLIMTLTIARSSGNFVMVLSTRRTRNSRNDPRSIPSPCMGNRSSALRD